MSHQLNRPAEAAEAPPIASSMRRRLDVLIVEDAPEAAELLEDFIASFGHQARVAHCGVDALELVAQRVPDVVLLDLSLPDMTGHDVATEIRTRYGKRCRIVALTGYSGAEEREAAERAGCDAFMTKPVHIPDLEALLEGRTAEKTGAP
jgi:CheY-like chemotaxis protein